MTLATNWRAIRENAGYLLAGALFVGSLALNVSLALQLRETARAGARTGGLQRDDVLPSLQLARPEGAMTTVTFERPTLLYVFSPTCEWCKRDHANITALQQSVQARYDFVALTLNDRGLKTYLEERPYPGVVGVARPPGVPDELARNLGATPQLVVVDRGGRVQQVWMGALFDARQREAELFFGVSLPGLRIAGTDVTK